MLCQEGLPNEVPAPRSKANNTFMRIQVSKVIVMASPDAVLRDSELQPEMVAALKIIRAGNNPVCLISNHSEPAWFEGTFEDSKVQFLRVPGRQKGDVVKNSAHDKSLNPFDVLVLAVKGDDVAMGKNGGALLLGANWSLDPKVQALGLQINGASDLLEVVELTAKWPGQWYFSADNPTYKVRALSDLSTMRPSLSASQQRFARLLKETVKEGGSPLKALLAVTARSLLMEGFENESHLLFGLYPSSNSGNDDQDALSDFVHRLRTTVSQVRMAVRGKPLFIRHTPSSKRSAGSVEGDRTDPTEQLLTLHLNPYYGEKNRLKGRHVVVVDDCTTYGVSFGVAAALLRAAGAASVTGVALGKFGNQARYYDIEVSGNPFAPLHKENLSIDGCTHMVGDTNLDAQTTLHDLLGA